MAWPRYLFQEVEEDIHSVTSGCQLLDAINGDANPASVPSDQPSQSNEAKSRRTFRDYFFRALPLVVHPIIVLRLLCHKMFGNMLRRKTAQPTSPDRNSLTPPPVLQTETCPLWPAAAATAVESNADSTGIDGKVTLSVLGWLIQIRLHLLIKNISWRTATCCNRLHKMFRTFKYLNICSGIRNYDRKSAGLLLKCIGEHYINWIASQLLTSNNKMIIFKDSWQRISCWVILCLKYLRTLCYLSVWKQCCWNHQSIYAKIILY